MESQPAPKKAKTAAKAKMARSTQQSSELAHVASGDLRKEGDALTHTGVDLAEEKKRLMLGAKPSLDPKYRRELDALNSRKEDWATNNLFDVKTLHSRVQEIAKQNGVAAPSEITQFMARAVQVCYSLSLLWYLNDFNVFVGLCTAGVRGFSAL